MGRDDRTVIAVDKGRGDKPGSLYALLREFLDAYNARTEVLANQGGDNTRFDAIIELLKLVGERLAIIHELLTKPKPTLKGRFTLILKNDQPDFGYDFDVSGITDAEGEEITDPAVIGAVVKEVTSDNEGVISATPPDEGGAGTIHVGTSGSATLTGRAWLTQADKDAGKDPAFVAAEPFTITTGDPAAITEGAFQFDIESGGTPPVE